MDYNDIIIPVYVINLKERLDRRKHIEEQFKDRKEFDLHIVEACKHEIGAVGLWQSISKIIQQVAERDEDDVIIICEDDHLFTADYNRDRFLDNVVEASSKGVDILIGGIGGFGNIIPLSHHLFWVDWFWSTQFLVVYKNAFNCILKETFSAKDVADEFISRILSQKMVLVPFISVQKEFGYSDVTNSNNEKEQVTKLFEASSKKVDEYLRVIKKYNL